MSDLARLVAEGAEAIRARDSRPPAIGIILGSGLAEPWQDIPNTTVVPYSEIPGFSQTAVLGHPGHLTLASLAGHRVAVLAGRPHFYEGHDPATVTLAVRIIAALGCTVLVVTNLAGALNPSYVPGDLVLIEDHINLVGLAGFGPLRGAENDLGVERFTDLGRAYDAQLRSLAAVAAAAEGIPLQSGVYAMVSGPNYETPAEARFLRLIGADVVGMSTANEVVVARSCGLRVLGISCIANRAGDDAQDIAHEKALQVARQAAPGLRRLVERTLEALP